MSEKVSSEIEISRDGKALLIKIHKSTRGAVDILFDTVLQDIESRPIDQPFYILVDFSSEAVGLTPYMRQRAHETLMKIRQRKGYFAFIFATLFGSTMSSIIMRTYRSAHTFKIFRNQVEAREWLLGQIRELAV